MGFFRREKPIHEQLADEAGLDIDGSGDERASTIPNGEAASTDLEYGEELLVEAPDLPGDVVEFVALPDESLIVEAELPEGAPDQIADVITVPAPYHAVATRENGDLWKVSVRRIAVVEVAEQVAGDYVELVVNEEGRSLSIDDVESDAEIPSLESFARQRFDSFSLSASRLDETLWEVSVLPL